MSIILIPQCGVYADRAPTLFVPDKTYTVVSWLEMVEDFQRLLARLQGRLTQEREYCTTICYHLACAHVQVMEAENSIILTGDNVFIALGWHSENDYDSTYQECEYIIRAMNMKHAHDQRTCYAFRW